MTQNQEIFLQIFSLSNQNVFLDALMIFGAVYLIWVTAILVIFLGIFCKEKEHKALFLSILGAVISEILIFLIHLFIFEPRPYIALSINPLINVTNPAAFPSVHTTLMAVPAFAYLFVKSKWTPLFMFFLIWVAISRIFVGVHYPFDILGGILVGWTSIFLSSKFLKKLNLS